MKMNDSFSFNCKQCGKCCKNRVDILLSPHDLFCMAKFLKQSTSQFFEKYCETYIGQSSKTPVVRLRPKTVYDNVLLREPQIIGTVCPLLDGNGHCIVQSQKPVVCALFPVGRFYAVDKKGYDYFMQDDVRCGDKSKRHTLKEWLDKFNILGTDEIMFVWNEFLSYAVELMHDLEKLPERIRELIYLSFLGMIYLCYDIEKDFLSQLEENIANFKDTMRRTKEIIKQHKNEEE